MPAPGESGGKPLRRSATVRQAVELPHVGGDPGAAFAPGAGGAGGALAAVEVEAETAAPEPAAVPVTAGIPETSAATETPTPSGEGEGAAEQAAAAEGQPPAALALGVGAEPPEHPEADLRFAAPGRPKKQMLAAAAIVGTLLVSVPFAVLALNSGGGKKQTDTTLAAQDRTVLGHDNAVAPPPGAFTPSSPTPDPSASSSPAAKARPATTVPTHLAKAAPMDTSKPVQGSTRKPTTAGAPPKKEVKTQVKNVPVGFTGRSGVLLRNQLSGHCADLPNFGRGALNGPVREYYCRPGAGDNQTWDLKVTQKGAGPGSANLFVIRNTMDGYCMDLPYYGGKPATTKVTEFHCDGSFNDNQLWWLDKRPNGTYWIRNYSSNQLCLDVTGHSTTAIDLDLTIFTCSDTDDQNWTFMS